MWGERDAISPRRSQRSTPRSAHRLAPPQVVRACQKGRGLTRVERSFPVCRQGVVAGLALLGRPGHVASIERFFRVCDG